MSKSVLEILQNRGDIQPHDIAAIEEEASSENLSVEDILYRREIPEDAVAEAKSEAFGYPIFQVPPNFELSTELIKLIPPESMNYYHILPIGENDGYVDIGMLHPDDITAQEALKFITTQIEAPIRIFIITPSDFEKAVTARRTLSGEVGKALGEFQKEFSTLGDDVKIGRNEPTKIVEDAPVTKMFAVILRHAVEGKASDIHIEPSRNELRIRFRVDGALHKSLTLPMDVHSALVNRVKILTNMKIDEARVPQDGRFHAEILNRPIDFRVSTLPSSFGEKVVIRILDPSAGMHTLNDLGIWGRNLKMIEDAVKRPYGLILITGPTGSGKSTTLYTILSMINDEKINVISLEDPVEYYIDGANQSQIRPEIGYTFASGLRSILRQDPDVIMVGEIRDKETAALAVHAALTGHLVFSTLHTNNASGVIPRLIDMGLDPFLISATLVLAIAQRLGRTLCPDSRKEIPIEGKTKELILHEIETMPEAMRTELLAKLPSVIYGPLPSPTCPKGTRGRMGVYETLFMSPELEKIILSQPSELLISEEAIRQGMLTMRQDGILKVLHGLIGIEELYEVT